MVRSRAGKRADYTAAVRQGKANARLVLDERRRLARGRRAGGAAGAGLVVAVGDSWFDYPFVDVLEELEQGFGYEVESVAHRGETAEEMAYDAGQLDKLARSLERLARKGRPPKALLLSAGGNDIAGGEFAVLLNHKRAALPALSEEVASGVFSRVGSAIASLAAAASELVRQNFPRTGVVPILVHGYDYPVPDGRGYMGGFWLLPGPWLEPGFRRKGYLDLEERCRVMKALIDRLHQVLADLAGSRGLEHVRQVDLRGLLSNALERGAYKAWWKDELHPTGKGFRAVASRFDQALRTSDLS